MISPPSSCKPARYPDFLGVGAQKSGTTWLHNMLSQHPGLWLPPLKEIHYFDVINNPRRAGELTPMDIARVAASLRHMKRAFEGPQPDFEKMKTLYALTLIGMREHTDDWYGRIFGIAPPQSVCGEITPEYAHLPDAGIEHVLRLNPRMKIVFLMRDPIERGWSSMRMAHEKTAETGGSVDFLRIAGSPHFLRYGDYMATIERYRKHAGADNMLLLYFDDVTARPLWLLERVCEFLGVPFADATFRKVQEPKYQGQKMELERPVYERLRETLRPSYERLLALDSPVVRGWYDKHYAAATA